jgi:hypothetical protein
VSSSKPKTPTVIEEPSFNISEERLTKEDESQGDVDDSDIIPNPFMTNKPD